MDGSPSVRIAVVDDEEPICKAISRGLRLASFEVASYPSGEDFLASVDTFLPACLVIDLHMPGMSGLEVGARLRDSGIQIPVIVITASDTSAIQERARASGVTSMLCKPFSMNALRDAIAQAVT